MERELLEKTMFYFKCCESRARTIVEKYRGTGELEQLRRMIEEG